MMFRLTGFLTNGASPSIGGGGYECEIYGVIDNTYHYCSVLGYHYVRTGILPEMLVIGQTQIICTTQYIYSLKMNVTLFKSLFSTFCFLPVQY